MRAFFYNRQRYRCSSCKTTMLLKTSRDTTRLKRPVLLAIAMVMVIFSVTFAIGYWERMTEANWRAAIERP